MTPILYLDVDGVVNALSPVVPSFEHRSFTVGSFAISWHPPTVARLVAWLGEGRITITWLTTWEGEANSELGPVMGIPRLPAARRSQAPTGERLGPWWKLAFVQDAYDRGEAVIWVDDDIATTPHARHWLATTEPDRMLALSPEPEDGLGSEHLDLIDEWLTAGEQPRDRPV